MPSDWHDAGLSAELDAYTDWAMGPGRPSIRAFDEPDWYIPVVIELEAGRTPEELDSTVRAATAGMSRRRCLCLPPWYRQTGGGGEPYRLSALVTGEFFEALDSNIKPDLRDMISRIVVGQRLSPATVNQDAHGGIGNAAPSESQREKPLPEGGPEEGTVVLGVIDDAIAFAHERFRSASDGSRVEYAWVQDLDRDTAYTSTAVPYGREYDNGAINRLLKNHTYGGSVDEDQLYRRAGLIDFSRPGPKPLGWRVSHGTHVMDLACGEEPAKADASRPIVCVQLPAAVTADTSGAGLAPYVLDGIWYILDRADEIARKRKCGRLPVVINFSYGFLAGPHDGTHPIELTIDAAIERREAESPKAPLAVVLPAGNSHLARCHAEVSFKRKEEEVILDWRILPDDETSTFLEIWLPYRPQHGDSRLKVSIAPPGHEFDRALGEEPGKALAWQPDGHVLCKLSYELVPASKRGRLTVAVLPTASDRAAPALAPSGLWRVKLENTDLKEDDVVHLWIQRDDTPHGYPVRGRQSYFEDEDYERFDPQGRVIVEDNGTSKVRRAGSISAIATGERSVVVGGCYGKNGEPVDYSAGGPTTPKEAAKGAHRFGPDALAVSEASRVGRGVRGAGSRSGSVVAMNGTSVAAPRVAREIADGFALASPGTKLPPPSSPAERAVRERLAGKTPKVPHRGPQPGRIGGGP